MRRQNNPLEEKMPLASVCPFCGSRKIGKEESDSDYFCDDCLEFFEEPKEVSSENSEKKEGMPMAGKVDKEKVKELIKAGKTDTEIAKEIGVTPSAIYQHRVNYKKSSQPKEKNAEAKPKKIKTSSPPPLTVNQPKSISDITIMDMLIAERNQCQNRVFALNKAIELLS
jgi:transposase-like protein